MMSVEMKNHSIQGLRAFLVALVVASHCQLLGQGGVAVCFFFCLSGFLAIKPFSQKDVSIHSMKDVGGYYLKKAAAIIPPYWSVILLIKLLTAEKCYTWRSLFRAMFFIECPGHFWYIQQTCLMYFVTPLFYLLLQSIGKRIDSKKRYLVQAGILLILSTLFYKFLTVNVFYLLGNGIHQPFWIWAYLIGMAFGLIYKYLSQKKFHFNNVMASVCSIALLAFPVFSSDFFLRCINPAWNGYYIGWQKPVLCVFLAGFLLMILSLNPQSLGAKVLSWKPLIKLGDISYETYIVHMFFISALSWSSYHCINFILVYIVSIITAFIVNVCLSCLQSALTRK